jgi:tRNA(Leu) C34 or U34 (ribose-2'-O)-methylase TrmL
MPAEHISTKAGAIPRMAVSQEAAQKVLKSLGFRTEALLSDFVRNDHDLTESLVIMSYDSWQTSLPKISH